jgi:predicted SnoaL-like aldol condensation-catalyzing enzyme
MSRETERSNLRLVKDAMDGILVHHDLASVTRHFHPRFVQHNPWAKDGAAHVQEMCAFTFGLVAARWAAQGDLVAYHGLYTPPNPLGDHPLVCVDVWRVQGAQIVEHRDALAPTPAADAEGMIAGGGDGLADVSPSQVSENAVRARALLELGVLRGDAGVLTEVLAEGFRQHVPGGGGAEALRAWIARASPRVEVMRTVASGDLVFTHQRRESADGRHVVFDVFRFNAAGRITDQWTVQQDLLPLAEAANTHPHF